jgi:formylglycine-generating enzyme required for sulfatase activity
VTISRGFWIGQTPVTQEAWKRVMGNNPSSFKGSKLPVENISWDDAKRYGEAVGMRLLTEAEWEYAARAGSTASRYGPLDEIAWYDRNSEKKTHEVGGKQPNDWGLFDMLGNVSNG